MIGLDDIVALVPDHLPAQRWYAGDRTPDSVELVTGEQWLDGDRSLWWLLVDVTSGDTTTTYQLLVGATTLASVDDLGFLHGRRHELLGTVDVEGGDVLVYDAVIDRDLALELLRRLAPDEDVSLVRALSVEQSNTSLVYDERIIVKVFRQLHPGANPDVEAVEHLQDAGFTHTPEQLGVLRRDGTDLAVARRYLVGAVDGWHLALTSLRDLFGTPADPADAGGDFGPDARRLGTIVADLHLRLAEAYGTEAPDADAWTASFRGQLDRVRDGIPADQVATLAAAVDEFAALDPDSLGIATRIHGDFHLGQTLRSVDGWSVIDFEGEPARPIAERVRPSSPLRDVAGLLRSFHYAAEVARREHGDPSPSMAELAEAWEERNRAAFLDAYLAVDGIDAVLPPEPTRGAVLRAFELDKATYELAYELGHRPDWVSIPLGAIARLTRSDQR